MICSEATLRVAYIEDDDLIRECWETRVPEGVYLITFPSPESFLLDDESEFDLIVSDYWFDRGLHSGLTLAREVWRSGDKTPFYLCTSDPVVGGDVSVLGVLPKRLYDGSELRQLASGTFLR